MAEPAFRRAEESDSAAIAAVHRDAFGTEGEKIVNLVDALRQRVAPLAPVGLVAEADGEIVGHVMLSHGWLDAPRQLVNVMTLSPLGVRTDWQRRGVGGALIGAALKVAEKAGVPLVFLEGDPRHYSRHGFERADALGFRAPSLRIPPPAFQVARLSGYASWMTGTHVYAETFWSLDCVGLRQGEAG